MICVVCQDAKFVMTEGSQYATGSLIACPACSSGSARQAQDCFADLDPLPNQAEAIRAARALGLAEQPAGWFVLSGTYGSGKSTIARALCETLASRGLRVRTYTAPELKQELYDSYRAGNTAEWLSGLKRARALFIDEMDSVTWRDERVEEMMSELLNARYQAAASGVTILAGAEFGHIPGRILSRMRQFGVHDLGTIDLRQQQGADPWAGAWDRGE